MILIQVKWLSDMQDKTQPERYSQQGAYNSIRKFDKLNRPLHHLRSLTLSP